jgi:hypothetical protein
MGYQIRRYVMLKFGRKFLWIAVFCLWATDVFAQVDTAWVRIYPQGGPYITSSNTGLRVAVDDSRNVYVTGMSKASGKTTYDYLTLKYLPNGDTAWVRRFNGSGDSTDVPVSLVVDDSGYVYVAGYSYNPGTSFDYTTIKYRSNGNIAWTKIYNGPSNGSDWITDMAVDGSGDVFVTGFVYVGASGQSDYATIMYHPNGDTGWVRKYNGPGSSYDLPSAIAVDGSGNAYVTGYSIGPTGGFDYATIKYHPTGDTAWIRRYDGPAGSHDLATAIAVDNLGNVYVTGYSVGIGTDYDYATIKYYANGDTAWVRRHNGPGNGLDQASAIAVDGSGNVYVTGWCNFHVNGGSWWEYATIKYYPNGDVAWVRYYKGELEYSGSSGGASAIALDGSGNIYVTGGLSGPCVTIKYLPSGDTAWSMWYGSVDSAQAIAVDDFDNVYVTGFELFDSYYLTIKYVQLIFGDVNVDGVIDVGDVVYLINYLFKNGPTPSPSSRGDVNCDRNVDVGDAVYLINYLFKGGPKPSC